MRAKKHPGQQERALPIDDPADFPVIIVGAGQAGLAMNYCLQQQREIRHVLFERERIGHAWRAQRWDSFCLVRPNWQCRLPGHAIRALISKGSC